MGTCCAALCASPPAHRSWEQVQSASSRTASTASYAMMRHSPHAPHMILRALASGPSLQSQPSRKNRATDRLVPFDMNARGVLHKNACMTTPHAGARALACMAGASKHAAVADTDATCRRSIGARRASKRMRAGRRRSRELAVTRTRSGASRANEHCYRGCAVAAVAATRPYPILAAACLTLGRPGRGGARRASGHAGAPRRAGAGARAGRRTRAPPSACGRSGCWARRPPRSRRKSAHTAPCAAARLLPCGRRADPHCVMHPARSQQHAHCQAVQELAQNRPLALHMAHLGSRMRRR